MKKPLFNYLLFTLLLMPVLSFAQKSIGPDEDITGLWKGELYIDSTKQLLPFEIAISVEKGKLTGFTYVLFEIDGKKELGVKKVKIKRKDDGIILEDVELIANTYSAPPPKGVKVISEINITENDTAMFMKGNWSTNQTRIYTKITGSMQLQRLKDFRSPALYKQLEILHLDQTLSFVQDEKNKNEDIARAAEEKRKADFAAEEKRRVDLAAEEKRKSDLATEEKRKADLAAEEKRKSDLAAEEKRKADLAAEDKRKSDLAAEAKRTADLAAEEKRKADLAAEEKRKADLAAEEKRKADLAAEDKRKSDLAAEAKRKSDLAAEAKRKSDLAAEDKRKSDLAAEEKRKADLAAEAKRTADLAAEEKRKADLAAEEKRKSDVAAEAKRKADLAAEEKRKSDVAAEAKRKADLAAEAKRKADLAAEAKRKSDLAAEAKRKADIAAEQQRKEQAAKTTPVSAVANEPIQPVIKPVEKPASPTVSKTEAAGAAADVAERKISSVKEVFFQSDSLVLTLYDNGYVDGDTVSVIMNGNLIFAKTGLSTVANTKTIYIDETMPDTLMMVMYAENLGSIPPNTGLLIIMDGEKRYEVRFSSDLKSNAAILLRRQRKGG